jgi:hypothetical protein
MLINASIPVEVPPTQAIVYDSWVIKHMIFVGEGITRPVQARITFQRGKKNDDGSWVISSDKNHELVMDISDVYEEASSDPDVADAISKVLGAVTKIGKSRGIL